ncbi:unnamed protein product [Ilex paraguariensis]|uniref:Uncharacterized protein n=1 Tax=Ilex paraguariensis TaxID=185542 RepID=A0ABC8SS40_9AQUA
MDLNDHIERVLWTEEQLAERISELASQITQDFKNSSLSFLADLVRKIKLPVTIDFIRAESYGSGTKSNCSPRISCDLKLDVQGKHVILKMQKLNSVSVAFCNQNGY